jgi:DNA mismatch endonuclease (patch repair protein)
MKHEFQGSKCPRRPKSRDEIARNMSAIRSKENRTETALRKSLHANGLRYRKYVSGLIGRPDIIFPKEKVAVFVDGDYWHGRIVRERGISALLSYYTAKQQPYWVGKISRNVARDDKVTETLQSLGWLVLRFWEEDVRKDISTAVLQIQSAVRQRRGERRL